MDKQYIDNFKESEQYTFYKLGEDYYKSENTAIKERNKKTYVEGYGTAINPFMANHKLPSGYFTKVVDQKVNYLLGNGVKFEDEALEENKDELVEFTFDDYMQEIATTSAKKAVGWAYFYVDNSELKLTEVPPEQIIPYYNNKGELEILYRCYLDGKDEVIEEWTTDGVKVYKYRDGKYMTDGLKGHYSTKRVAVGNVLDSQENVFASIPFIPLWNEKDKLSDLRRIKPFIDIYDVINSDFANNIDDMQDAFFTIKNYNGEGLEEFLRQLKALKAVPVGEDGGVDAQQLEIPTEARDTFLKLTEQNIYKFSMSVDTTQLAGSSLTNVAIQAQFTDLDLKADKFETQIAKFISKLVEFINAYEGTSYDSKFTLERSMIMNRIELMTALREQVGVISRATIVKNHPLVDDDIKELKLLDEEAEKDMVDLGGDIGFNESES